MMSHPSRAGVGRTLAGLAAAWALALLASAAPAADEAGPEADQGAEAAEPGGAAEAAAEVEEGRGSVTNLPIPRFVSLKVAEGNARRGPSLSHRIDWVFVRRGMPLEITGEYGHWRRVRDRDGAGGWVHYSLLSGSRTVIVAEEMADLRMRPERGAPVVARSEAGVVAQLGDCGLDWCRISAGGYGGWVEKARLWGVAPAEIRD